jgi:hypothetical protein
MDISRTCSTRGFFSFVRPDAAPKSARQESVLLKTNNTDLMSTVEVVAACAQCKTKPECSYLPGITNGLCVSCFIKTPDNQNIQVFFTNVNTKQVIDLASKGRLIALPEIESHMKNPKPFTICRPIADQYPFWVSVELCEDDQKICTSAPDEMDAQNPQESAWELSFVMPKWILETTK